MKKALMFFILLLLLGGAYHMLFSGEDEALADEEDDLDEVLSEWESMQVVTTTLPKPIMLPERILGLPETQIKPKLGRDWNIESRVEGDKVYSRAMLEDSGHGLSSKMTFKIIVFNDSESAGNEVLAYAGLGGNTSDGVDCEKHCPYGGVEVEKKSIGDIAYQCGCEVNPDCGFGERSTQHIILSYSKMNIFAQIHYMPEIICCVKEDCRGYENLIKHFNQRIKDNNGLKKPIDDLAKSHISHINRYSD
jgi:hypothetical protein